ncbi:MAG: alpha/beta hydrolase [Magnetococcales bacterium]|nr:alpha/beta hydrolase [Magnetococcales bacterium]MBF0148493.1 alpha/beta hydrolase [Magnetococcales bacterium]MBF0173945.1 alpha/beta hydrolase [Magnetococcales bacterium]MBF0632571.1 alpha/beta hydrolase [Magnetococcales bacterium]
MSLSNHLPLVVFSHGKEGTPWGGKIQRLTEVAQKQGFEVESIDYRDLTGAELRVERLIHRIPHDHPALVLVGSSMGGYQSIVASAVLRPRGLFLMAPAIGLETGEYAHSSPVPHASKMAIVHGWEDDVVAPEKVITFARLHRIPLTLLPDGHRLLEVIDEIAFLFSRFLETLSIGRGRV